MAVYESEGLRVYYMALHRRVLVAYVCNPQAMDYKAYIYPVPGLNHSSEASLWESEGEALSESQARALWGGMVESLEADGYGWRL